MQTVICLTHPMYFNCPIVPKHTIDFINYFRIYDLFWTSVIYTRATTTEYNNPTALAKRQTNCNVSHASHIDQYVAEVRYICIFITYKCLRV